MNKPIKGLSGRPLTSIVASDDFFGLRPDTLTQPLLDGKTWLASLSASDESSSLDSTASAQLGSDVGVVDLSQVAVDVLPCITDSKQLLLMALGSVNGAGFEHVPTDAVFAAPSPTDDEPAGLAIAVDGSATGLIDFTGDTDTYTVSLVAGERYTISLRGTGATALNDTFLQLFDPSSTNILNDDDGGNGLFSLMTVTAATTGTYTIQASSFANPGDPGLGEYTLDVLHMTGVDTVLNTLAGAVTLNQGNTFGFRETATGPSTATGGDSDLYKVHLEAGKNYQFSVAGGHDYASGTSSQVPVGEINTLLTVFNSLGQQITGAQNNDLATNDKSSSLTFYAATTGDYYVQIAGFGDDGVAGRNTGGYAIDFHEVVTTGLNPLDAINWASAANITPVNVGGVPTAYVYFAVAGENFGENARAGDPTQVASGGNGTLVSYGWNATEQAHFMEALAEYTKITGITYVVTANAAQATFRAITTNSLAYGAYAYPQDPGYGTQKGILAFNINSGGWDKPGASTQDLPGNQVSLQKGGFAFGVMLHELGHAHGLAHPHDNGGGSQIMPGVVAAEGSYGVFNLNQGVYTVMSYNEGWDFHPDGKSPFTVAGIDNGWSLFGAFDIAELQLRYGVHDNNLGDTVYTLTDVIDAAYYETIVDTGGNDTIAYGGALNAIIDLTTATIDYSPTGGGVLSYLDNGAATTGLRGGFTIAQNTLIENATGGSGNDQLVGNDVANVLTGNGGNDTFMGRGGNDTIVGGLGTDTVYFDGVRAHYTITPIVTGGVITGYTVTDNFAAIAAGSTDEGTDTLSGVETLHFSDVTAASLTGSVLLYDASDNYVGSFTTIQAAVTAASDGYTVSLTTGTYVEQVVVNNIDNLTIEAASGADVTIQAPADVVQTGTRFTSQGVEAVVTAIDSLNLTISGITVDGAGVGNTVTSGDEFSGVFFRDSSGSLLGVDVTGVRDAPLDGVQRGRAVLVDNPGGQLGFTMTGGTISDFQKNGIVVNYADVDISGVTITGAGIQQIAQNGIVISNSTGSIDNNTISGIGTSTTSSAATGILGIGGNSGLDITNNHITGTNGLDPNSVTYGVEMLQVGFGPNSGGSITGNTIDQVDEGVGAYDAFSPAGVTIYGNNVTNVDTTNDPNARGIFFDVDPANTAGFIVTGTEAADLFSGGSGADQFTGHGGNDDFTGNGGDDTLYGDGGTDTAHYAGAFGDYTVGMTLAGGRVVSFDSVDDHALGNGDEGTDTLTGIDVLAFNGTTLSLTDPIQLFDGGGNLVGTFATIQAAVDASLDGYTVNVAAGTYNETVTVDHDITIVGSNSGVPGAGARGAEAVIHGGVYMHADGATLDGLTVLGGGTLAGNSAGIYIDTDNVTLTNLVLTGDGSNDPGLSTPYGGGVTGLVISDSLVQDWGQGTYFNPSTQFTATGNTFDDNGNAIIGDDWAPGTFIDNNVFSDSVGSHIGYGSFDDVEDARTYVGTHNTFNGPNRAVSVFSYGDGTPGGVAGQVITGTDDRNGFFASENAGSGPNATYHGLGGNDDFFAGSGNDTLDGGIGIDTAFYDNAVGDYAITTITDASGRIIGFSAVTDNNSGNGDEGSDTLISVEKLNFGGTTLSLTDPIQLFDGSNNLVGTFATIQAAVNAADDNYTVKISAGTYVEQVTVNGLDGLTIEAFIGAAVTIQAPADVAPTGLRGSGQGVEAVLTAINSHDLTISGIEIDGAGVGNTVTPGDEFSGVFFRDSSGSLLGVDVTGVRDAPLDGVQRGRAVLVDNPGGQLGFTMTGGTISDFQKNGIVVNYADVDISGVTITGSGVQQIAQNGIVISNSTGSIDNNTISGIGTSTTSSAATGILGIGGNSGLDITDNHITGTNGLDPNSVTYGVEMLQIGNGPNSGGSITGNTIDHVDEGVGVYDNFSPSGVAISGNTVTNLDTTNDPNAHGVNFDVDPADTASFTVGGTGAQDLFHGGAGNDQFTGLGGNDDVDGGAGTDTVVYADTATIAQTATGWTVTTGTEGTDTLANVEIVDDAAAGVIRLVGNGGYASIQAAVDASANGDTIVVASGTYNEVVTVNKDVTIQGANNHGIDGNGARGAEAIVNGGFYITAAGATLDGLEVLNGGTIAGNPAGIYVNADDVTLTNMVLQGQGTPSMAAVLTGYNAGTTGLELSDSKVTGWAWGTYFNPTTGFTATGNTFASNGNDILGDGWAAGSFIDHNSFANSAGSHIGYGTYQSVEDMRDIVGTDNSFTGTGRPVGVFAYGDGTPGGQDVTGTENADGIFASEFVAGSGTDSSFHGLGGNDYLYGGSGNDSLDGGTGTDTAAYDGASTIVQTATGWTVTTGTEGTDTLANVEIVDDVATGVIRLVGNGGYATIQAAIDASANGDTIRVASGTWNETLSVNKDVTIEGANHDVFGTGARGAETIITGGVNVTANGVTINGVKITGTIDGLGAPWPTGIFVAGNGFSLVNSVLAGAGAPTNGSGDNSAIITQSVTGLDVGHNLISGYAIGAYLSGGGTSGSVHDNRFQGDGGPATGMGNGVNSETSHVAIAGNTFDGLYSGVLNLFPFGPDSVDLNSYVTGNTLTNNAAARPIQIYPTSDSHNFIGTGEAESFNADQSGAIGATSFDGQGGNDHAFGGEQGDTLTGGSGDDELYGNGGSDILSGGDNNDILQGGAGDDQLSGGAGTDTLDGGDDNDSLDGGAGVDVLNSGNGTDTLHGGAGNDALNGGAGTDTATYDGPRGDYSITMITGIGGRIVGFTAVSDNEPSNGNEGTDSLVSIERLQFSNRTLDTTQAVQLFDQTNQLVGTFDTIQGAVNVAQDDYTIRVAAGVFDEDLVVNVGVRILGARANSAVTSPGRDAANGVGETTIIGHAHITATDNVTFNGLRFLNDSTTTSGGPANPLVQFSTGAGHLVTDSIFWSTVAGGANGVDDRAISLSPIASGDVTISGNLISGTQHGLFSTASFGRGIWFDGGGVNLTVSDNIIEWTRSGLNLDMSGSSVAIVDNNHFQNLGTAVAVGISDDNVSLTNNDVTNVGDEFSFRNLTTDVVFNADDAVDALTPVGNGNDYVVVLGGSGNDTITGTSGADYIDGNNNPANPTAADNDVLNGGGGNDLMFGRYGNDTLDGGSGDDTLDGGDGNDALTGGSGDDTFIGGAGTDTAIVGSGAVYTFNGTNWTVTSSDGTDTLTGIEIVDTGPGPHTLLVGSGGFSTIQAAVDASHDGDTILVATGAYVEQVVVDNRDNLTIKAATGATVTIQAPADLHETARSISDREVHAVFTVKDSASVVLDNIDIDGNGVGNTVDEGGGAGQANFYGVFYRNSSGSLLDVDVAHVRDPLTGGQISGVQRGVGVVTDNNTLMDFSMIGGSISDFQKNATAFNGSNLTVTGVTISGGGAISTIAQNGIQVTNSTGTISGNTITDIGYTGGGVSATGVLGFGNSNLNIQNNTIVGANLADPAADVVGVYITDFGTDNSGGSISGNNISYVDTGVVVTGDITPAGILIENNAVTHLDATNPDALGIYFEPNPALATPYDVDGTAGDDFMSGGSVGDSLSGLGGNDTLTGNGGNDSLDGGAGIDTATYAGPISDYTVAFQFDGSGHVIGFSSVVDHVPAGGDEGSDTLTSIEKLSFGGNTLALADPVQLFDSGNNLVATFSSIQAAINAASADYTIRLAAGTYAETLTVNKDVTILGPNHGTDGTATRGAEAVITGGVNITANGVTIDGVEITGTIDGLGAPWPTGIYVAGNGFSLVNSVLSGAGAPTNGSGDNSAIITQSVTGLNVGHNLISGYAIGAYLSGGGTTGSVHDNRFQGDGGGTTGLGNGVNSETTHVTITGNTFDGIYSGSLNLFPYGPDTVDLNSYISSNAITDSGTPRPVQIYPTDSTHNVTGLDVNEAFRGDLSASYGVTGGFVFDGRGGDDHAWGGEQGDTLTGGSGTDELYGNGGNDTLSGGDDNDLLQGGAGADSLNGGSGVDTLSGGADNDVLTGSTGNDSLDGGTGADTAVYSGTGTIVQTATGWTVTTGTEGTDTLANVEIVDDVASGVTRLVGNGGYATIQAAINASSNGDTILVASGTWTETLDVNKDVTILGASNRGIDGTGVRGAETVIDGQITINAAGATLDGVKLVGAATGSLGTTAVEVKADNFTLTNSILDGSGDVAIITWSVAGLDIGHNLFHGYSIGAYVSGGGTSGSVHDNRFQGNGGGATGLGNGVNSETTHVAITGNTFDGIYSGSLNLFPYGPDTVDLNSYVSGNSITHSGTARPVQVYPSNLTHNITGTNYNEAFRGDLASDSYGVTGAFTFDGRGGDDRIYGGQQGDTLSGGIGHDQLFGNGGNDILDGGLGDDLMIGDTGDDLYYVDSVGDAVFESEGEGIDEVRTSLATYALSTYVDDLTYLGAAQAALRGNSLDNVITGGNATNRFDLHDGGNDSVFGGSAPDLFYYGNALTSADQNYGGGSNQDVVLLQGDYSITLGAASLVDVEYLALFSGSNTTFGDFAGNTYSYDITTVDANVTGGHELRVNGVFLGAGENFTFDGSAETDSYFLVYGSSGTDDLTGGSGNDGFFFEGTRFGSGDKVDGGAGDDVLILRGIAGVNTFVFGENQLTGIEYIAPNDRFATTADQFPSYDITLAAGNMPSGGLLTVSGLFLLQPTQTFVVDGSAIHTGNLRLYGGAGNDTLTGGTGNDLFIGFGGHDTLTGGQGADTFQLRDLSHSTNASPDHILDFAHGVDVIDLHFIDANASAGGDQAFTFSNDGAFHHLAGELRTTFDTGNNWWTIQGDVNGDGVADFTIDASTIGNVPIVASDFIL